MPEKGKKEMVCGCFGNYVPTPPYTLVLEGKREGITTDAGAANIKDT